jgi:hypothetical protein
MRLRKSRCLVFMCLMMGCGLGLGARLGCSLGHIHTRNVTATTLAALLEIQDTLVELWQEKEEFPAGRNRQWKVQLRPLGLTRLIYPLGDHAARNVPMSQPLFHALHFLRGGEDPEVGGSSLESVVDKIGNMNDKVETIAIAIAKKARRLLFQVIPLLLLVYVHDVLWYEYIVLPSAAREWIRQSPDGFDSLYFCFPRRFWK